MSSLRHMSQLDGLRGVAILCVFAAHFLQIPVTEWYFFPYGSFGVRLFFVLSGFLITAILIRSRSVVDGGIQSVGYTLRAFYARRGLRLFAIYYLWLLATQLAFGGDRVVWDAAYLSNLYDILYLDGHGNQYWSLAIEEQFYLVWPLLVLVAPKRSWKSVFLGTVVIGVAARLVLGLSGVPYLFVKKIPITCFDAMGAGAIIALGADGELATTPVMRSCGRIAGLCGFGLLCVAMADLRYSGAKEGLYTAALHTSFLLLSSSLLIPAINGYQGWLGSLLGSPILRWIGRISYGCYLYHNVVQRLVMRYCSKPLYAVLGESYAAYLLLLFAKIVLSLLAAQMSWLLIEKHLMRLKTRFPMRKTSVPQGASAVSSA